MLTFPAGRSAADIGIERLLAAGNVRVVRHHANWRLADVVVDRSSEEIISMFPGTMIGSFEKGPSRSRCREGSIRMGLQHGTRFFTVPAREARGTVLGAITRDVLC